ncbi:MAG: 1-acyl-sn-glycerol-3-phosphate acyltransferase [Bacteroidales bacterium]|nr:1-acyl-sn-glycerol-3-phosphate acyltransferase [Bacteroidales bacterium]
MLNERPDVASIGEKYIDIKKILLQKKVRVPNFAVRWLERLLHVPELNQGIYLNREYFGLDFVHKFLEGGDPQDLNITIRSIGEENIPTEGNPMIVGNHPLGGPDGLALMGAVGRVRGDIKFPVNDFLLYLPGLRELFYPIDKVNRNRALASLEEAFASEGSLLYFPAGLCSRLQKGEIRDLEWKATFIKKAVRYRRDVVPVYTDARNRMRLYRLANIRKRLGVKFNFEMALLPAEMFAQRNKTFTLTFGRPIPWQTFDKRHTAAEWAEMVKEHVYQLKSNPQATFMP